jgi:hypothetical protein
MGPHRFFENSRVGQEFDDTDFTMSGPKWIHLTILVGGKINIYKIKTFPLPGFEPGTLE